MNSEKNGGEQNTEKSVQQEAQEILANPEIAAELTAEALKDKGMLQRLSEKTHRGIKAIALAFAMLVASEAKDAAASEMNKSVKVEQQKETLEGLKVKYKVPDELRKLAEYEDQVANLVRAYDLVKLMAENKEQMLKEEIKTAEKFAQALPSPESILKINSSSGRSFELDEYSKSINGVNRVGGELESRMESGYTISDEEPEQGNNDQIALNK